jgi:diketogulonate reductase-like aldo/keto reductase
MAYSPIEQGRLLHHAALKDIASRHDATPVQIALAWLLRQDGTIVIPKSANIERIRENRDSASIQLSDADVTALDRAFPPPKTPRPLEIL